MAYWGLSFGDAERDSNLDKALEFIQKGQEYIDKLQRENAVKVLYPTNYADCRGWLLYKLGKFEEAVKCLEHAVALEANAGVYLHLAIIYKQRLQEAKDDTLIHSLMIKAQAYCQHVDELDIKREYKQIVEDLRRYFQDKSQLSKSL